VNYTKVNSTEKKKKDEKNLLSNRLSPKSIDLNNIVRKKELDDLSREEIDNLTIEDLEYLRQKYEIKRPKSTIIGKKPYKPFLAGIIEDNWMSVGDKIKDD